MITDKQKKAVVNKLVDLTARDLIIWTYDKDDKGYWDKEQDFYLCLNYSDDNKSSCTLMYKGMNIYYSSDYEQLLVLYHMIPEQGIRIRNKPIVDDLLAWLDTIHLDYSEKLEI